MMEHMNKAIDKEYWLKKLSGELPEISLPFIFKSKEKKGKAIVDNPQSLQLEIPIPISAKLKKAAKNSDMALFILFLSGVNVVLDCYAGVNDLVVGTVPPAKNGNNVIFCRGLVSRHLTVKEFIFQTRQVVLEAINHGEYSLDDLLEVLKTKNPTGFLNIFNTSFIFEPFQKKNEVLNRFGLLLILRETNGQLKLQVRVPSGSLSYQVARGFGCNLLVALERMLDNPGQELAMLDIISPEEKKLLLHAFNDTAAGFPKYRTIHELFAEQVKKTPDQVALVGRRETHEKSDNMSHLSHLSCMSYKELNEKSNQLAMKLEEKGARPGAIVGILVERTVSMMMGLLGILKTGAAYLPLDPEYPGERLKYIIEKSNINILLTHANLMDKYHGAVFSGQIIDIYDGDLYRKPCHKRLDRPGWRGIHLDPAYVIYTSGSTGNPKGVVINHKNVVNFIMGMTSVIDFSPGKTILALTTISFDIFLLETLLPVTCGLRIVISVESEQRDPHLLKNLIRRHQVEMFQATPSRLQLLLTLQDDLPCLAGVKELMVGGEAFPPFLFEGVKNHFQGKIYNVYGPTETTVWSTVKELTHTQPHEITIGSPIVNTQIYIMGTDMREKPLGVAGELLIGGDGVGMGYLDNVRLTAEKFVRAVISHLSLVIRKPGSTAISISSKFSPNDHSHSIHPPHSPHSTIYRTGDLARWLPNGEVEFLGRLDHQVKIRGFRVELEEIQEQLMNYDGIKEVVVDVRVDPGQEKHLCAYLVPVQPESFSMDVGQMREKLLARLPYYMVPSYFIKIEAMPLTPNGKIDRKALPEPGLSRSLLETGGQFVAPVTDNEKRIASIWKEILGVDEVGINDNFFDLGGNSLKVILLNQKLQEVFGIEIPIAFMFRNLTINFLDQYLDQHGVNEKQEEKEEIKHNEAMDRARQMYTNNITKFIGGLNGSRTTPLDRS